jgi:hypothetical protein
VFRNFHASSPLTTTAASPLALCRLEVKRCQPLKNNFYDVLLRLSVKKWRKCVEGERAAGRQSTGKAKGASFIKSVTEFMCFSAEFARLECGEKLPSLTHMETLKRVIICLMISKCHFFISPPIPWKLSEPVQHFSFT